MADLKTPLCISYLCEGISDAIQVALGCETRDGAFTAVTETMLAVLQRDGSSAETEVARFEARVAGLSAALEAAGFSSGHDLLRHWLERDPHGA